MTDAFVICLKSIFAIINNEYILHFLYNFIMIIMDFIINQYHSFIFFIELIILF